MFNKQVHLNYCTFEGNTYKDFKKLYLTKNLTLFITNRRNLSRLLRKIVQVNIRLQY